MVSLGLWSVVWVGLGACGSDTSESETVDTDVRVQWAWVGQQEDGLRVVAEPLAGKHGKSGGNSSVLISEEELVRRTMDLEEDASILRLHLVGKAADLQTPGRLQVSSGKWFQPFADPPHRLSLRARTFWIGVGHGGLAPDLSATHIMRRSFLMHGEPGEPEQRSDTLIWERGGQSLSLEARTWNERERRDYLDPAHSVSEDE